MEVEQRVQAIAKRLIANGQTLAIAESCTGGWLAKCLTDLAGSSGWFECGIVSYSNAAKQGFLDVPPELIDAHGAVSDVVVKAMTQGLLSRTTAHWALAISGVAGPGGGTADKPVGTVWIAWQNRGEAATAQRFRFDGNRESVRLAAVAEALHGLDEEIIAASS